LKTVHFLLAFWPICDYKEFKYDDELIRSIKIIS